MNKDFKIKKLKRKFGFGSVVLNDPAAVDDEKENNDLSRASAGNRLTVLLFCSLFMFCLH